MLSPIFRLGLHLKYHIFFFALRLDVPCTIYILRICHVQISLVLLRYPVTFRTQVGAMNP